MSDRRGPSQQTAKRGRPRLLDEDRIVEAALKLARTKTLENVSMRALANELGVPVMTIYNYVPNKEALSELVVNHVLRPVRVPTPEEGSWEDRLRQLERSARRAMAEYPGLSFNRRGSGSGAAEPIRLTEGVLSILGSAGFDPSGAALAFSTLFTFMMGQIELDSLGVATEALDGVITATRLSRDEIFEFGFDAVIEGLKARLPRDRGEGRQKPSPPKSSGRNSSPKRVVPPHHFR